MTRDIHENLKAIIREAVRTQHNLPPTGCRPASWGSTMPDYVREVSESYGYDSARIGRITPTADQITRLDMVCAAMATPLLTARDRDLLWAVAARAPWKAICAKHGMSRTWINRLHARALVTFGVELANTGKQRRAA
jgi:hypothetical protein